MKLILSVLMIFYGCNGINHKFQETTETNVSKGIEKFEDFFYRFNNDTIFQKTRLHSPILQEVVDDESNREEFVSSYLENVKVSFNQKDWEEKVFFPTQEVSKDTTIISIKGVDTGIWIEHYFINENGLWYLYKIRDISD